MISVACRERPALLSIYSRLSRKTSLANKNRVQSIAKLSDFAGHLQRIIHATLNVEIIWTENLFGELASKLFELQRELNGPFRSLCLAGGKVGILKPQDWKEIPAVPTSAFKDLELSCLPANQRTTVFHSSGTTKYRPSRHFHDAESLLVYEESLLASFSGRLHFDERRPIICLTPPQDLAPHSSLVHMFETLRRKLGSDRSVFLGDIGEDGGWALNVEAALEALRRGVEKGEPMLILGTAFLYVHLLDYLTGQSLSLKLPAGSVAMETGGYKGRSRTLPKEQLHQLICERLGVSEPNIICEYGMSELSSQAYYQTSQSANPEGIPPQSPGLRGTSYPGFEAAEFHNPERVAPRTAMHVFHFPPWARVQIISPETGREVKEGETGLIRVFDLANVFSVMAIQTEDLGIRRGDGFELIGRASLAEARGCSLMTV
jgi:hypothetical protein